MQVNCKTFLLAFSILVLSSCHQIETGEYYIHQKTNESLEKLGTTHVVETNSAFILSHGGDIITIEKGNSRKRKAKLKIRQKVETVKIRDIIDSNRPPTYGNKKACRIAQKLFQREKEKNYSLNDLRILLNVIRNNREIKEPYWLRDFTVVDDHPVYGDGLTTHQRKTKNGREWWWREESLDVIIDSFSVNGYAHIRDNGFEFISEDFHIIFSKLN
jgi:hypothetical protein